MSGPNTGGGYFHRNFPDYCDCNGKVCGLKATGLLPKVNPLIYSYLLSNKSGDYVRGQDTGVGHSHQLVAGHIGSEVLKVGRGAADADAITGQVAQLIKGHLVVGDTLYLYPVDRRELMKELGQLRLVRLSLRHAC